MLFEQVYSLTDVVYPADPVVVPVTSTVGPTVTSVSSTTSATGAVATAAHVAEEVAAAAAAVAALALRPTSAELGIAAQAAVNTALLGETCLYSILFDKVAILSWADDRFQLRR